MAITPQGYKVKGNRVSLIIPIKLYLKYYGMYAEEMFLKSNHCLRDCDGYEFQKRKNKIYYLNHWELYTIEDSTKCSLAAVLPNLIGDVINSIC